MQLPTPLNTYAQNKQQIIPISRVCTSSRHVMQYTNLSPRALTHHSKTRRSICRYIWSWEGLIKPGCIFMSACSTHFSKTAFIFSHWEILHPINLFPIVSGTWAQQHCFLVQEPEARLWTGTDASHWSFHPQYFCRM